MMNYNALQITIDKCKFLPIKSLPTFKSSLSDNYVYFFHYLCLYMI